MEFVKWNPPNPFYLWTATKEEADSIKLMLHYQYMSQMTAEEKIQYFLDNILVDNG